MDKGKLVFHNWGGVWERSGDALGTLWGRSGDALVTLWDALARRRHRRTNRRRGGGGGGVGKEKWGEGDILYTSNKLPIALLWRHVLVIFLIFFLIILIIVFIIIFIISFIILSKYFIILCMFS